MKINPITKNNMIADPFDPFYSYNPFIKETKNSNSKIFTDPFQNFDNIHKTPKIYKTGNIVFNINDEKSDEKTTCYQISAMGLTRDEIDITSYGNQITVDLNNKVPDGIRSDGEFKVEFSNEDKIKNVDANLENGILYLTVYFHEENKKKIEIK
jgi:HSP20 family molecular chaperone IbpA